MSSLVKYISHSVDPTLLYAANLSDANGSVRPGGRRFIRIPYKDLNDVLSRMKALVQQSKGNQVIRQKAVDITQNIRKDSRTGLPNRRDFNAIAKSVYSWMNTNIQYIRDPHEIELLQAPVKTLELGYGDCDDQAILGASLLSSLGVPTQFKVVKANPGNPSGFSHVYVVYHANGQWKAFDPTLHTNAGDELAESQIFGTKFISLTDAAHSDCGCNTNTMSLLKDFSEEEVEYFKENAPVYDIHNGQIINDELGFVGTAVGIASGLKSTGALDAVKGIFGKKEENAGSSSLVDALNNYEKVSNSLANSLVDPITQMLANGATDTQVANYIDSLSYKKGSAFIMDSWKWDIVKNWLNQTRSIIAQNNTASQSTNNSENILPGGSPVINNPLATAGISIKSPVVIGVSVLMASGIVYAVISQRPKSKK